MVLAYWAIAGTFYLCILTFQDYKNKGWVDDRYNYLMLGLTFSIISHVQHALIYYLGLLVVNLLLRWYLKKYKPVGEGDINTFFWIFLGLGFIDFNYYVTGGILFIFVMLLVGLVKFILLKDKKPVPFYGIILIYFVLTSILLGLYKLTGY